MLMVFLLFFLSSSQIRSRVASFRMSEWKDEKNKLLGMCALIARVEMQKEKKDFRFSHIHFMSRSLISHVHIFLLKYIELWLFEVVHEIHDSRYGAYRCNNNESNTTWINKQRMHNETM